MTPRKPSKPQPKARKTKRTVKVMDTYSYEIRSVASGMRFIPVEDYYCPACGKVSPTFAEATRHHEKGCES